MTWVLTVASLSTSSAAISALESPRAISRSTSRSRGVSALERARAVPRRRAARELLDQPLGDRRRDQRVAGRDHPHRGDQLLRRDVLEQEPAGARRAAPS